MTIKFFNIDDIDFLLDELEFEIKQHHFVTLETLDDIISEINDTNDYSNPVYRSPHYFYLGMEKDYGWYNIRDIRLYYFDPIYVIELPEPIQLNKKCDISVEGCYNMNNKLYTENYKLKNEVNELKNKLDIIENCKKVKEKADAKYGKTIDICGKDNKYRFMPPTIISVEVYNDRVVMVGFGDGTWSKSVCSPNDKFDLDTGITICVLKRILSPDAKMGNRMYNNFLRNVHKYMEDCEKEKQDKLEQKKANKLKMEKQLKKNEEKKKAAFDEAAKAWKDIITSAVVDAMNEGTGD